MRTGILLTTDEAGKVEILGDPSAPISDLKLQYKDLLLQGLPGKTLQLWESGYGITKKKRFAPAKSKPAPAPKKSSKKKD